MSLKLPQKNEKLQIRQILGFPRHHSQRAVFRSTTVIARVAGCNALYITSGKYTYLFVE